MSYQTLEELIESIKATWNYNPGRSGSAPSCVEQLAEHSSAQLSPAERSVPQTYRWATVDAPELVQRVRLANPAAEARAIAGKANVVILGPAALGKTSLAVAAFRVLGSRYARFVHAVRLGTARIQHRAGDGEAESVDIAMGAPMILLDDVGNERQTATNAVPDVIFERHAAELPTWYTTAFEPAEIARRYGEGIARRMFERATIVDLGAKT